MISFHRSSFFFFSFSSETIFWIYHPTAISTLSSGIVVLTLFATSLYRCYLLNWSSLLLFRMSRPIIASELLFRISSSTFIFREARASPNTPQQAQKPQQAPTRPNKPQQAPTSPNKIQWLPNFCFKLIFHTFPHVCSELIFPICLLDLSSQCCFSK